MEVGLGPGDIVLGGYWVPSSAPQTGRTEGFLHPPIQSQCQMSEESTQYSTDWSISAIMPIITTYNNKLAGLLSLITFRVSRRPQEMYCGHARLCVCLSVRGRMPTLFHGPGCNLAEW